MDIFDTYATNETLENEGTWIAHQDAKFKIARAGNTKYSNLITTLVEENQLLLDKNDAAADKLSDALIVKTLASTVLLGWEGSVTYKGKKISYSIENAEMLLSHKDFRYQVLAWSRDINNYKAAKHEEQLGN